MATKRTHQNDKRRKDASEIMARRFRRRNEGGMKKVRKTEEGRKRDR